MTDTLHCADESTGALVDRYVAGQLDTDETERFETHYLTCARCQEEVRFRASVRRALRTVGASESAENPLAIASGGLKVANRPWGSWPLRTAIGLAIAAGIAVFVVRSTTTERRALAALGNVAEAPIYLGMPVRAGDPSAQQHFDLGMRAYADGRYAQAIDELQAAVRAEGNAAPPRFFLGISHLMTGNESQALTELRAAAAIGDTPYRGEAHYYAAKALLRSGAAGDALSELRRAAATDDPIGTHAAALADSVRRMIE